MKECTLRDELGDTDKSNYLKVLLPILCLVIILAHFVSSFFPSARLWGINHLAYFSLEFAVLLLVVFSLLFVPGINFRVQALLRVPLNLIHRSTLSRSRNLWFVLFSLMSFPLFWVLRTRTHFLGDSYQVISHLEQRAFFVKWSETGETLFRVLPYKIFNPLFNMDAATLYELSSCFLGAVFVFLIFLLVDLLGENKWEKLFLFCLVAFMGSIQLFCGYAEHYSFTYIWITAFIFSSLKYLKGEGRPFLPLLFLVLAVFSHISASYLLPSAFLLYVLGYRKDDQSSIFGKKETWAILMLTVISVIIFLYTKENSWTVAKKYVPLTQGDYYAPGYTLFSTAHILDIVSQQLLVSPVGFILLISIWVCLRDLHLRDRSVLFLFSILVMGLGFNFSMYSELGMSRDWDLFSSTAIGYTILAAYCFLKSARKSSGFRYLCSILVITAVFCTLPWIMLNTSEHKTVERFRNLLDLDPKKSRNGHHALVAYFDKMGLSEEIDEERQAGALHFPELGLLREAFEFLEKKELDSALQLCKQTLVLEPNYYETHLLLGKIYDSKGSHQLAEREMKLAIDLKPKAQTYSALGYHYVCTQELDSALYCYKKAERLSFEDARVYNSLGNVYSMQENWSQAIRSFKRALQIDPCFAEAHYALGRVFERQNKIDQAITELKRACELKPDFAPAHYHLAYFYSRRGQRDKAEKELAIFSEYTSDRKEVEKLKQLIESL